MMNETRLPRVAAIHDLSSFGRCSLSVIIPVLSTLGVQVCPIPTAVLSAHTGGLGEVAARDLTDYLGDTLAHYKTLGLDFESVYSGFLNSAEQIDLCLDFFGSYPNALAVVDPVMGDHGKPYRTYSPELIKRMSELVRVADIITPNLTEVSILLGLDYPHKLITAAEGKSMLARLSEQGPAMVVITGMHMADGKMANLGYDRSRNAYWRVDCDYIPVSYPGTGDIFAAALTGGLLTGSSLPIAISRATSFIELAIKTTHSYNTDTRHGVMLEKCLHYLSKPEPFGGYTIL